MLLHVSLSSTHSLGAAAAAHTHTRTHQKRKDQSLCRYRYPLLKRTHKPKHTHIIRECVHRQNTSRQILRILKIKKKISEYLYKNKKSCDLVIPIEKNTSVNRHKF